MAPTEIHHLDPFAHLIGAANRRQVVLFAPNATVPREVVFPVVVCVQG